MFNKRHYIKIAELLKDHKEMKCSSFFSLVEKTITMFSLDNSRFNRDKFLTAIYQGEEEEEEEKT